ncbi:hypothetical protein BGZ65_005810 [Modicella reniformis]|uniref:F-box domain-containing protein n=1 Tax=Modicella reniformis TaxID=1440133 RepID=A0A9P6IN97_9FUNG|nr:hypothetical protein BGZ65_005810 [Modicella reniformis]
MSLQPKAPSAFGPTIFTRTPPVLRQVLAIPELVDQILQYVSPSDIGSLRRTSWLLWNVCSITSPKHLWFYKDVFIPCDDYDCVDDTGLDSKSIPIQWGLRNARFVRSIVLDLPSETACDEYWDIGDRAVTQCPNLTGLSYVDVEVMMNDWEQLILDGKPTTETHGTKIARQLAVVANQLKTLHLQMTTYYEDNEIESPLGVSDEILLLNTDEHDLARWIQAVDRILECIILSTGYMTWNTTQPAQLSFSSLQVLSLSGCEMGDLRVLEWSTMEACLQQMPVLRELELIRIKLVSDSLGNIIDVNTSVSRRHRGYIPQDKGRATRRFWNLRKLLVTEPLSTEMVSTINRAFPKAQELSVSSPSVLSITYKTSTTITDSRTAWEISRPFPYLRRLKLIGESNTSTMDLTTLLLPSSLADLHIEHPGSFNLPVNISPGSNHYRIWNAEPGTSLKRLCMEVANSQICQDILPQECCRHLTELTLTNGAAIIRGLLSNTAETTDESGVEPATDDAWTCDHLEESFVKSKLAFIPLLRLLHLGGEMNQAMSDAKAQYINRLLQFMPKLQDFSTNNLLDRYQVLFYRLGRPVYHTSKIGPNETLSLRTLTLNPSSKLNVRRAEDDLRQQFPFLSEITWMLYV